MTREEAGIHFGLLPGEAGAWHVATRALQTQWGNLLTQALPNASYGEWIGWYRDEDGALPHSIVQILDFGVVRIGTPAQPWPVRFDYLSFTVLPSASIL